MKIVKNFPSRISAEQAQGYLRKHDIESIIQASDIMFGASGGDFVHGADLYVLEKDYQKAHELVYNTFDGI